ncbi:ATP-dependent DNA helicase [Schizosaccharomyces octosporus yFS286]|uniref:DNA helicase n=1 Tax=Schizosaccharomyces octosporus (strain yFS286) TaxID=483514 RepID=S9Q5D5_SCHOY|nr:ATP-dependent DNA helicase [Schizosaccharomyces octosporus yFS286]EPX74853.1 ATP-dependent DNA helicase [Schizosaccharomyces octosporus yFS286]
MTDDDSFEGDEWDSLDVQAVDEIEHELQNNTVGLQGYSVDEYIEAHNQEPLRLQHELDRDAANQWIYPINVSFRDYQFNIVKKALFQNVLVALPTGLGKTFIAATVMMNYFRWFPKSYVIFMAPTKPLVTQQMEACYNITGIPRNKTAELSGQVQVGIRNQYYQERNVFFVTPQTLLNDIKHGICDRTKVSCLVIDEAHRSTGNYAYVEVVRLLYFGNKNFRVLALSATPGSKIDAIQNVIDSLHISCIEIRNENSIDIAQYVHKKEVDRILVDLSPDIMDLRDRFAALLEPMLLKLNQGNLYRVQNAREINSFTLVQAKQAFIATSGQNFANNQRWDILNTFDALATFAYPLNLLLNHGVRPFCEKLQEIEEECSTGRAGYKRRILANPEFKSLLHDTKVLLDNNDFYGHPKLEHLQEIVANHFGVENKDNENTRIMIFVEIRSSAEEIFRILSRSYPTVRPAIFIGQSSIRKTTGMSQKSQNETVRQFQKGDINTLIATSIGEEGLDIGEVDMIICYDASASPIRMLQRMGRTGRKRKGYIYMLLTRGKEEAKWERAKDAHKTIQDNIIQGRGLALSDKSHRILPKEIQPMCEKKIVEIPKENSVPIVASKDKQKQKTKKKFFMPENALHGFIQVSSLTKPKRSATVEDTFEITEDEPTPEHNEQLIYYRRVPKRMIDIHKGRDFKNMNTTSRVPHSLAFKCIQSFLHNMSRYKDNTIIYKWREVYQEILREESLNDSVHKKPRISNLQKHFDATLARDSRILSKGRLEHRKHRKLYPSNNGADALNGEENIDRDLPSLNFTTSQNRSNTDINSSYIDRQHRLQQLVERRKRSKGMWV